MTKTQKPPFIWTNVLVLGITFLMAITVVPLYGIRTGFDAFEWTVFGVLLMCTGYAITMGYHRLWSHRAFKAHWSIRVVCAFFGAGALQNSILNWSADHRNHHKSVDNPDVDPYAATRGFWYSHIGWILRDYRSGRHSFIQIKDLERDPVCQFQHRHYLALAITVNLVIPLALGWWHGKLWGTFLLAGIFRIVVNHHLTFFINSLAHIWGRRPYSTKNSSRDNPLLAIFTYGEGYHNYHHSFQYDYRNGIKWYHFDPSKWMIRALSWVGLVNGLRTAPRLAIHKAKLETQRERALNRLEANPALEPLRQRMDEAYQNALTALEAWNSSRQEWLEQKHVALTEKRESLNLELARMKTRYRQMKSDWALQLKQWQQVHRKLMHSMPSA